MTKTDFSFQYQYNIKQTGDENIEKYQLGDYKLIQYQFLQTNITRTVWTIVRRITNEILEVKGLGAQSSACFFVRAISKNQAKHARMVVG